MKEGGVLIYWTFRKKAEQAEAREAMKEKRSQGLDMGGGAGQQGGPASTV